MLDIEVYSFLQNSTFNIGPARSCLLAIKALYVAHYTAITNRQHQQNGALAGGYSKFNPPIPYALRLMIVYTFFLLSARF